MNILIIRVSSIGDVIHTLPSLFLLKQCLPTARIGWVVQKKAAHLLINQPFIDYLWILPDQFLSPCNLPETLNTITALRSIPWDVIIDFQGILKTSILLAPLRGTKFGFDRHHARWPMSSWFTHNHTTPEYRNIIQKNLALAADVVYEIDGWRTMLPTITTLQKNFFLHFPLRLRRTVDDWFMSNKIQSFIALCPNTTWPSKHWPTERWFELIVQLTTTPQTEPIPIIIIGTTYGNAAAELFYQAKKKNYPVLALPSWDLLTTAYALTKSTVLVAPDTGLLHLADFLNIPAIGIFGPTNKDRHGAFLQQRNIDLAIQVECPHRQKKHHGSTNCMANLPASMVIERIVTVISQENNVTTSNTCIHHIHHQ